LRPGTGPWLAPIHEPILQATLLSRDRAAEAWATLRRDPAGLRARSSRELLPLLVRSLDGADVLRDEDAARMRTARDATWFENRRLFATVARALEALDDAGIRTMVSKGVPLALHHDPDPSLRPMADADLLVAPEHAPPSNPWRVRVVVPCRRDPGTAMLGSSAMPVVIRWQFGWKERPHGETLAFHAVRGPERSGTRHDLGSL
jgi:hypothetical protein